MGRFQLILSESGPGGPDHLLGHIRIFILISKVSWRRRGGSTGEECYLDELRWEEAKGAVNPLTL